MLVIYLINWEIDPILSSTASDCDRFLLWSTLTSYFLNKNIISLAPILVSLKFICLPSFINSGTSWDVFGVPEYTVFVLGGREKMAFLMLYLGVPSGTTNIPDDKHIEKQSEAQLDERKKRQISRVNGRYLICHTICGPEYRFQKCLGDLDMTVITCFR